MNEHTLPTSGVAKARSAAYSLFSQLVASPFDAPSLVEAMPPLDLGEIAVSLQEELPYDLDLDSLVAAAKELGDPDAQRLADAYSGLFEVGSEGAPIPLREELSQKAATKTKEEILRFYEFFGYTLTEDRQWAPDHLAVQLEFMHFLIFREASHPREEPPSTESSPSPTESYRRAQRDFLQRHLCSWVPEVLAGVRQQAQETYWLAVFSAIHHFLSLDFIWLAEKDQGPR